MCARRPYGGELLTHRLAYLPSPRAAYLEATTARATHLYRRHGFVELRPYALPGGPLFFPMWRPG